METEGGDKQSGSMHTGLGEKQESGVSRTLGMRLLFTLKGKQT